jgi:hypothetical protein
MKRTNISKKRQEFIFKEMVASGKRLKRVVEAWIHKNK